MSPSRGRIRFLLCAALITSAAAVSAQTDAPAPIGEDAERHVRAHLEFLASDAMRGRGSGTHDELIAATYIAAQLRQYGVQPAGDKGGYVQRVSSHTWNVLGSIPGSDPELKQQAILLSAHFDHVGEGKAVNGDSIYGGADDDASGVAAVLELARALSSGPRPRRTVIFAFFGSEETGGVGSKYFREHPPAALPRIVANLQFEMIGRPDSKVPPHTLWLTGFERSDLGPQLAAHGALLVADPHPDQDFFRRSDNYVLAKEGVVAHTISSYGLHPEYHQPDDEIELIDFPHLVDAITSMIAPVRWLANSQFVPQWNPGKKP